MYPVEAVWHEFGRVVTLIGFGCVVPLGTPLWVPKYLQFTKKYKFIVRWILALTIMPEEGVMV